MTLRKSAGLFATVSLVALASVWCAFGPGVQAQEKKAEGGTKPSYTADGKLKRPVGHRRWVYIGTPITPNDLNDGEAAFPEFHAVYIDTDSFAHYEKTGEFPDGTTLVKELISVGSKEAPSGKGYFMGDMHGLDVAVKDSKRFKDEPGAWAYFNFNHKLPLKDDAVKSSAVACNKCHQDNAKTDWVFTQYYPVLRDANPKKK
jgi:hypothetical protein